MAVLNNEQDFQKVLQDNDTVLVDFYADWCGPCKMMAPVLEEFTKENPSVTVCKVNVDDAPQLASKFSVMSIPTFISFKNGAEHKSQVGVVSKDFLEELTK